MFPFFLCLSSLYLSLFLTTSYFSFSLCFFLSLPFLSHCLFLPFFSLNFFPSLSFSERAPQSIFIELVLFSFELQDQLDFRSSWIWDGLNGRISLGRSEMPSARDLNPQPEMIPEVSCTVDLCVELVQRLFYHCKNVPTMTGLKMPTKNGPSELLCCLERVHTTKYLGF